MSFQVAGPSEHKSHLCSEPLVTLHFTPLDCNPSTLAGATLSKCGDRLTVVSKTDRYIFDYTVLQPSAFCRGIFSHLIWKAHSLKSTIHPCSSEKSNPRINGLILDISNLHGVQGSNPQVKFLFSLGGYLLPSNSVDGLAHMLIIRSASVLEGYLVGRQKCCSQCQW